MPAQKTRKPKQSEENVIAVISDVHSNLEALTAVMHEIPTTRIYACGDLIGYNANPNEVLQIMRDANVKAIKGNHELSLLENDYSGFNLFAARALTWNKEQLTPENLAFIQNLPEKREEKINGKRVYFCHGSPRDPREYLFPEETSEASWRFFLTQTKADVLVCGHTHVPFIKKIGEKLIVNPGSVGQPRDGDARASFALIDTEKMDARVFRVKYQVEKTVEKIKKAGLPKFLAERLTRGQ